MAERRMFARSIVLSDAFLDMPMSARCLYFTLGMFADDDGFVGSPKGIMRQCGASQDDMQILIAKKFVLDFETGVIVIKHWRINNYLRSDRHQDTTYQDELSKLKIDGKGAYTRSGIPCANQVPTTCLPDGIPSIGKDSIDKNRLDKSRGFTPPTLEQISEYCRERANKVDPERFFDYYQSQNWKKSNGQKLSDWKAAVRTWEKRDKDKVQQTKFQNFEQRTYADDLEERLVNR